MAKKPDFDLGSITKKMNIGGIMDNVKSMIGSTDNNINPEDGDTVGALLAQLNEQAKEASAAQKEQAKRLDTIANIASQIYAVLQAAKTPVESAGAEQDAPAASTSHASEKTKKDDDIKPKESNEDT